MESRRRSIHCVLYQFLVPLAMKGGPEGMYLDHGSTSTGDARWFRNVMCEEKLNQFMIKQDGTRQVSVIVDLENASFAKNVPVFLQNRRLLMLKICLRKLYRRILSNQNTNNRCLRYHLTLDWRKVQLLSRRRHFCRRQSYSPLII